MCRGPPSPKHQELLAAAGSTEERGGPWVMERFGLGFGHQWGWGQLGITKGLVWLDGDVPYIWLWR